MSNQRRGGSRQAELFPRSRQPVIPIEANHRLVRLADTLDWSELESLAEAIRASKSKSAAGRPPHLRVLLGAMILRATRRMSYREAEDQIRHYAPARYLCGLTETDWTPDHNTLHDFAKQMGEEGARLINEYVVHLAVDEKLADPEVVVGDTTAQEAAIPHPTEMGHMAAFMASVMLASKKAGRALREFAQKSAATFQLAKEKLRRHRLFAKTREARRKLLEEMIGLVDETQHQLGKALAAGVSAKERLVGHAKVAQAKAAQLHETMNKLLPQVRYWMNTGKVAANKIITIHIPELYSVVRSKLGKAVEFGLKWGFVRLRGGFLLASVSTNRRDLTDTRFALQAVDECKALFGKVPRAYAYDRGGWSMENVAALVRRGVKHVALAPLGQAQWHVRGKKKQELITERAQIEGSIGAVKSGRYGFHRPAARSVRMMAACGQQGVLGYNLNKLVRELAKRSNEVLVG